MITGLKDCGVLNTDREHREGLCMWRRCGEGGGVRVRQCTRPVERLRSGGWGEHVNVGRSRQD